MICGQLNCSVNKIINFKGYPNYIGSKFHFFNNPIESICQEIDVEFIRAFNTFKVLKDNTINLKRLKYVMEIFDKPIDLEKIKKYYIIK